MQDRGTYVNPSAHVSHTAEVGLSTPTRARTQRVSRPGPELPSLERDLPSFSSSFFLPLCLSSHGLPKHHHHPSQPRKRTRCFLLKWRAGGEESGKKCSTLSISFFLLFSFTQSLASSCPPRAPVLHAHICMRLPLFSPLSFMYCVGAASTTVKRMRKAIKGSEQRNDRGTGTRQF